MLASHGCQLVVNSSRQGSLVRYSSIDTFFSATPLTEHVEQSIALSCPGPRTSGCVKTCSDRAQPQRQPPLLAASLPDVNGQALDAGSMWRLGLLPLETGGHRNLISHYCSGRQAAHHDLNLDILATAACPGSQNLQAATPGAALVASLHVHYHRSCVHNK